MARRADFVLAHFLAGGEGCDIRLGGGESADVAFPIDDEQYIAFADELVVLDPEIGDKAGDVRRDIHHVGLHPGITRPG